MSLPMRSQRSRWAALRWLLLALALAAADDAGLNAPGATSAAEPPRDADIISGNDISKRTFIVVGSASPSPSAAPPSASPSVSAQAPWQAAGLVASPSASTSASATAAAAAAPVPSYEVGVAAVAPTAAPPAVAETQPAGSAPPAARVGAVAADSGGDAAAAAAEASFQPPAFSQPPPPLTPEEEAAHGVLLHRSSEAAGRSFHATGGFAHAGYMWANLGPRSHADASKAGGPGEAVLADAGYDLPALSGYVAPAPPPAPVAEGAEAQPVAAARNVTIDPILAKVVLPDGASTCLMNVTCPLLHPAADDVAGLDRQLARLARKVTWCLGHVSPEEAAPGTAGRPDDLPTFPDEEDGADEDVNCADVLARYAALQRARADAVARRAAFVTRTGLGRSMPVPVLDASAWAGSSYGAWLLRHEVPARPAVLSGSAPLTHGQVVALLHAWKLWVARGTDIDPLANAVPGMKGDGEEGVDFTAAAGTTGPVSLSTLLPSLSLRHLEQVLEMPVPGILSSNLLTKLYHYVSVVAGEAGAHAAETEGAAWEEGEGDDASASGGGGRRLSAATPGAPGSKASAPATGGTARALLGMTDADAEAEDWLKPAAAGGGAGTSRGAGERRRAVVDEVRDAWADPDATPDPLEAWRYDGEEGNDTSPARPAQLPADETGPLTLGEEARRALDAAAAADAAEDGNGGGGRRASAAAVAAANQAVIDAVRAMSDLWPLLVPVPTPVPCHHCAKGLPGYTDADRATAETASSPSPSVGASPSPSASASAVIDKSHHADTPSGARLRSAPYNLHTLLVPVTDPIRVRVFDGHTEAPLLRRATDTDAGDFPRHLDPFLLVETDWDKLGLGGLPYGSPAQLEDLVTSFLEAAFGVKVSSTPSPSPTPSASATVSGTAALPSPSSSASASVSGSPTPSPSASGTPSPSASPSSAPVYDAADQAAVIARMRELARKRRLGTSVLGAAMAARTSSARLILDRIAEAHAAGASEAAARESGTDGAGPRKDVEDSFTPALPGGGTVPSWLTKSLTKLTDDDAVLLHDLLGRGMWSRAGSASRRAAIAAARGAKDTDGSKLRALLAATAAAGGDAASAASEDALLALPDASAYGTHFGSHAWAAPRHVKLTSLQAARFTVLDADVDVTIPDTFSRALYGLNDAHDALAAAANASAAAHGRHAPLRSSSDGASPASVADTLAALAVADYAGPYDGHFSADAAAAFLASKRGHPLPDSAAEALRVLHRLQAAGTAATRPDDGAAAFVDPALSVSAAHMHVLMEVTLRNRKGGLLAAVHTEADAELDPTTRSFSALALHCHAYAGAHFYHTMAGAKAERKEHSHAAPGEAPPAAYPEMPCPFADPSALLADFHETVVLPGEALFIPGGHAYSLLAVEHEEHASPFEEEAHGAVFGAAFSRAEGAAARNATLAARRRRRAAAGGNNASPGKHGDAHHHRHSHTPLALEYAFLDASNINAVVAALASSSDVYTGDETRAVFDAVRRLQATMAAVTSTATDRDAASRVPGLVNPRLARLQATSTGAAARATAAAAEKASLALALAAVPHDPPATVDLGHYLETGESPALPGVDEYVTSLSKMQDAVSEQVKKMQAAAASGGEGGAEGEGAATAATAAQAAHEADDVALASVLLALTRPPPAAAPVPVSIGRRHASLSFFAPVSAAPLTAEEAAAAGSGGRMTPLFQSLLPAEASSSVADSLSVAGYVVHWHGKPLTSHVARVLAETRAFDLVGPRALRRLFGNDSDPLGLGTFDAYTWLSGVAGMALRPAPPKAPSPSASASVSPSHSRTPSTTHSVNASASVGAGVRGAAPSHSASPSRAPSASATRLPGAINLTGVTPAATLAPVGHVWTHPSSGDLHIQAGATRDLDLAALLVSASVTADEALDAEHPAHGAADAASAARVLKENLARSLSGNATDWLDQLVNATLPHAAAGSGGTGGEGGAAASPAPDASSPAPVVAHRVLTRRMIYDAALDMDVLEVARRLRLAAEGITPSLLRPLDEEDDESNAKKGTGTSGASTASEADQVDEDAADAALDLTTLEAALEALAPAPGDEAATKGPASALRRLGAFIPTAGHLSSLAAAMGPGRAAQEVVPASGPEKLRVLGASGPHPRLLRPLSRSLRGLLSALRTLPVDSSPAAAKEAVNHLHIPALHFDDSTGAGGASDARLYRATQEQAAKDADGSTAAAVSAVLGTDDGDGHVAHGSLFFPVVAPGESGSVAGASARSECGRLLVAATDGLRVPLTHAASVEGGDATACLTLDHLLPAHVYTFRVAAVAKDGTVSTYSEASVPVTLPALAPPAPLRAAPRVVKAGQTWVKLSWAGAAPADDGGAPVLGYLVMRADLPANASDDAALDESSLVFGHPIVVPRKVETAATATILTPGHPALQKTDSTAGGAAGGRSFAVLPAKLGVRHEEDTALFVGLLPGRRYVFSVAAINAIGVGALSVPTAPAATLPDDAASPQGNSSTVAYTTVGVAGPRGRFIDLYDPATDPELSISDTTPRAPAYDQVSRLMADATDEVGPWKWTGMSGFDVQAELKRLSEVDQLATLSSLYAATAVAFAHLRRVFPPVVTPSGRSVPLRASMVLDRSGLGDGVGDLRLDLYAKASYAGHSMHAPLPAEGRLLGAVKGLRHGLGTARALGIMLGLPEEAFRAASRVITVDDRAHGHLLFPGIAGLEHYANARNSLLTRQRALLTKAARRAAAAAAAAEEEAEASGAPVLPPTTRLPDLGSTWHIDAAYAAMAAGGVGPYTLQLGRLFDSASEAAAALDLDTPGALRSARRRALLATAASVGLAPEEEPAAPAGDEAPAPDDSGDIPAVLAAHAEASHELLHKAFPLDVATPAGFDTVAAILKAAEVTATMRMGSQTLEIVTPVLDPSTGPARSPIDVRVGRRTYNGWRSAWAPRRKNVTAPLVVSDALDGTCGDALTAAKPVNGIPPADAAASRIGCLPSNTDDFKGAIVVFTRGTLPLAEKVRRAAFHGAVGAIIVDDEADRCAGGRFTQACVAGSDKRKLGGFGIWDDPYLWDGASIPALLLPRREGQAVLAAVKAGDAYAVSLLQRAGEEVKAAETARRLAAAAAAEAPEAKAAAARLLRRRRRMRQLRFEDFLESLKPRPVEAGDGTLLTPGLDLHPGAIPGRDEELATRPQAPHLPPAPAAAQGEGVRQEAQAGGVFAAA